MDSPTYFYAYAATVLLLLGLLSAAVGVLIGWFAWRDCKANVQRIEADNKTIEEENLSLDRQIRQLKKKPWLSDAR